MSSKTKSRSSRKGGFSMFRSPLLTTNTIYKTKIQNSGIVEGVELYFIRHAHSCANMIEAYGAKGLQKLSSKNIRPDYAPNPHITNFGISHALGSTLSDVITIGGFNYTSKIQPDLVCASQLIRTWETAYTLFYQYFNQKTQNGKCKNPLYICPYIGENRDVKLPGTPYLDLDNQPEDIKTSKNKFNRFIKHFKEYIQTYYPDTINVDDLCTPNLEYLFKNGNIYPVPKSNKPTNILTNTTEYLTDEPDFNQFINTILPKLIQKVKQDRILKGSMRIENKPIRIVIVTHSKFMEENILKQLSSIDKQKILSYRNSEGKVKVYNCDVYKMSLVADINTRKTNIFFPENVQVASEIDFYKMPSPFKDFTDKNFSISNKNVSPQYFNQYFENLYQLQNTEKLHKMFDIIVGLCDKETKENGNKEYNYLNLLIDKLVGAWAKDKGNLNVNLSGLLTYKSRNAIIRSNILNNELSGLLTQTRINNSNPAINRLPNVNLSERETEVREISPYKHYKHYQNPFNGNGNENEFSEWNETFEEEEKPSINSKRGLTNFKRQTASMGTTPGFIKQVKKQNNLTNPQITASILRAQGVSNFSGIQPYEKTNMEEASGGKKKKRTVKKKSVKRKSTSFRKK